MNSEFNWWLLLVGLIFGGGLVWLVLADSRRRQEDLEDRELPGEAAWIREALASGGRSVDQDLVETVLQLHADYLTAPPPDDVGEAPVPEHEPEHLGSPIEPGTRQPSPGGLKAPGERGSTG